MMRGTKLLIGCVAIMSTLNFRAAEAGVILNDVPGGIAQIQAFEPLGNSFTAEDEFVTAALFLGAINSTRDPSDPIVFELYEGVGTSGTLLFSEAHVVSAGFTGFYDVDLTGVSLTVGNNYSYVASIDGTSAYWGLRASTSGSVGETVSGRTITSPGYERMALRITPGTAPEVPEPTSLAIFGLGALGLAGGAIRRRKKQQA